ncbi:MAG: Membrane-associated zinc metalloprotease [uncultured Frankineae bacterium]|uniref:Membrane-associated zinc metalloprotease n=1 Tax=uncultured Frankineae bacterium TaxID=437475 RepID=A0A6J4LA50_9ACTN|nr:MAG: Membrane-associated zinc metalloprotease [uncultured Frankineae bacterium]
MTNLLASRPASGGDAPQPRPPSRGLLVAAVLLVLVAVVGVATGNGTYLLGALGFVVALLVSVTLHEAGHFLTARRYGMKATQFFVGFGPTLWSRQTGETEWGVKAVPAGGFVKIVGMTQLEEVDPEDEPRAFWRQPWRQRAVVLAAGSTVHFVLAALLVLLGSFAIGKAVERAPGIGAISECVPVSASAKASCDDPDAVPPPAEQAGLRPGDVVVSVAGERTSGYVQFLEQIRSAPERAVDVVVDRDGTRQTLTVTPVAVQRESLTEKGEIETVGAIGVAPQFRQGTERLGPVDALQHSGDVAVLMVEGIQRTVTEKLGTITQVYSDDRDPEGFIGIVGAGRISGEVLASEETLSFKVLSFLVLVAGLNLFVGLFNLLPLLPLDGGHLAVLFFEQVRDRLRRLRGYAGELQRVDLNRLLPLTYAVVVFFAGFTVWLLGADIVNPIRISP